MKEVDFKKIIIFKRPAGMTLVEGLMALSIFTMAFLMVSGFIIYGYDYHMKVTEESLATDRVNLNIQKLTEELRTMRNGENAAFPLETALANEVAFYADVTKDGEADEVTYFLDGNELWKKIIEPQGNGQYLEQQAELSQVGSKITNDDDAPIFHYWGLDADGNQVLLDYPVDVSEVVFVEVTLRTEITKLDKERIVSSKVFLRNLRDY